MQRFTNRVLGLAVVVALISSASTLSADELPSAEELAEMDDDEIEELDDEQIEAIEEQTEADDEEDDEADAEDAEPAGDDWETSLRDPISPTMNTEGSMGFHGIASAVSPGTMNFQVGLLASGTAGSDFLRLNDSHRSLAASVLINASVNDYFGAHFGLDARNNINEFGRPQSMLAQGDVNFGATGRYEVDDGIWLGGDLSFYVPSSFDSVGISAGSTSVRPRLLASFDIDEMMGAQPDLYIPIVAHANVGYRLDNTETLVEDRPQPPDRIERTAYGISAYDMIEFGVGAEVPLPYVTPHLGWTLGIPVAGEDGVCDSGRALRCASEIRGSAAPQQLSLGAKAEPVDNLGLHAGVDFGLTSEPAEGVPMTFPYQFQFGISYHLDPGASTEVEIKEKTVEEEVEVEAPRGLVRGTVINELTGEPVTGAELEYVDLDVSGQFTDRESGTFRSYEFEPGTDVVLQLEHPDYETKYADWEIDDGEQEVEVIMEPLPQTVIVAGELVGLDEDGDTLPLGGGDVLLVRDNGEMLDTETDEDGRFEFELDAPGGLSVAGIVDDYVTAGQYLDTEADDELDITIEMERLEDDWLAQRADGQIGIDGRIAFNGGVEIAEDSLAFVDHVAAVLFENPDLMDVTIEGHTDDDGAEDELLELSEERAEAVRQALIDRGISPERLSVEGHGAESPLVPNTSSRNREMNRRIEFHF